MVHDVKSADGVNDSAKYGTAFPSVSTAARVSNTMFAMKRPGADRADEVGFNPSTSASMP